MSQQEIDLTKYNEKFGVVDKVEEGWATPDDRFTFSQVSSSKWTVSAGRNATSHDLALMSSVDLEDLMFPTRYHALMWVGENAVKGTESV